MSKPFRNVSDETVRVTVPWQRSVKPGDVIDVPDAFVASFENHPIFREVGAITPCDCGIDGCTCPKGGCNCKPESAPAQTAPAAPAETQGS